MILLVFSDIHGNIYSLEKALKIMERYQPDQFLFLGDMAGYYYYQNECIKLLNTLPNLLSIKGNHDDMFLKAISDDMLLNELENKYGQSYKMLKDNITNESFQFFQSMKDFEKNGIYEAYHGSPNNYYSEYIYPDNTNLVLDTNCAPYLFLGHTHYQMDKYINHTRVINPGSIGQPRDINQPSFAIIDTDNNCMEVIRYTYNKKELLNTIASNKDNSYLSDVLIRR